ncbi:hypothetical protein GCM10022226_52260 [Sphaerisporangium flaviroseum]|uniref:Uncharacterized protein n=1 Tax=Sphaerisporangium flaviroseum TaxID=509199 RepID=A0ABP7IRF8_9ACTN
MNTPTGSPEAEELSFGSDSPRYSWLRSWVFAHRRLLFASLAVLVLLGGSGGGAWYLRDLSRRPLSPPPDGPWPEQRGFAVGLCGEPDPGCPPASHMGESIKDMSGVHYVRRLGPA